MKKDWVSKISHVLMMIEPYWHEETWVFDDASKGLDKEPLEGELEWLSRLEGLSMIDRLVKDIPNARSGFILFFSSKPFAGYQVELIRVREENGGCMYEVKDSGTAVWLSPTLSRYFETEPKSLYLKVKPHRAKYDPIEIAALKDRIERLEQMVDKLTLENEALREERNKAGDS